MESPKRVRTADHLANEFAAMARNQVTGALLACGGILVFLADKIGLGWHAGFGDALPWILSRNCLALPGWAGLKFGLLPLGPYE